MILDSGERTKFSSGAVRDLHEGKGRCDLLPLGEVCEIYNDEVLRYIWHYQQTGDKGSIQKAVDAFILEHPGWKGDYPAALLDLAKHYEDGCKKYGERNWEKGIPTHCYIDSGIRHYLKFKDGIDDEPHDRAFLWNMVGLLWTLTNKPELIDFP